MTRGLTAFAVLLIFTACESVDTGVKPEPGGTIRFINNSPFTVRLVRGSGRTDEISLAPGASGTADNPYGEAESWYPLFDIPLTRDYSLLGIRPGDRDLYYEIDNKASYQEIRIAAPQSFSDASAYIVFTNNGNGGVYLSRNGSSSRMTGINFTDAKSNVNTGETLVYRENPRELQSFTVRPGTIGFSAAVWRPGYIYSFSFDGSGVSLIDARPLHRIGESAWVKTIPDARGTMPLAAADGRLYLFAPTDRGLTRYDFDSAGNAGTPPGNGGPNGDAFDITFAARSAAGFFIAGYETDGRSYRPIARIYHKEDGALMSSLAPSARRDCRSAYFLTAAPKDDIPKDGALWLAAGGGGDLAGHTAYVRLVHEEDGALTVLWELAGNDFDTKDPAVKCGPVKAAAYDSGRDRWLVSGETIEFDSLRRPVPGSYIAGISNGGIIAYIDTTFKGMSVNKITVDAAGDWYLAGEERRENETLAVLLKFGADGGRLWQVSGSPPAHSYYEDAALDGENNRIVLGGVMRAANVSGSGGLPFVQAVDTADGTNLWLEPLSDPALDGAVLVTGICRAPDYGFAVALSGIAGGSYAKPFMIARINSQGALFRYRN
ncbi:MAG: hypothetical protein LBF77_09950 [Spirochaetaceae bacterium]|jgi:hypothetical protein|nr:hypothetical protein [Spirochaetaceae bacterium]